MTTPGDDDFDDDAFYCNLGLVFSDDNEEEFDISFPVPSERMLPYDAIVVAPEDPDDLLHCPRILTESMMQQIHQFLRDTVKTNTWERSFAIGRDGDSFRTLLDYCAPYTYSLIVIRTVQGHILGGFASRNWQVQDGFQQRQSYYGTGQSFLFSTHPEASIDGFDAEPQVAKYSKSHNNEPPLQFFSWTGTNDYCQLCSLDKQVLCMGGEGGFGWTVQDNFERGQSGRCRTYGNPPFKITDFEVYDLQSIFSRSSLEAEQHSPSSTTALLEAPRSHFKKLSGTDFCANCR